MGNQSAMPRAVARDNPSRQLASSNAQTTVCSVTPSARRDATVTALLREVSDACARADDCRLLDIVDEVSDRGLCCDSLALQNKAHDERTAVWPPLTRAWTVLDNAFADHSGVGQAAPHG